MTELISLDPEKETYSQTKMTDSVRTVWAVMVTHYSLDMAST